MASYRVIRTHNETYVADVTADSPEKAIETAKKDLSEEDFEYVESSAYEYEGLRSEDLE